jgi:probable aminopeptidase NPEPL1
VETAQNCCKALQDKGFDVTCHVVRGEELESGGFGGIYGVGKASVHMPALVIMSHVPAGVDPGAKSVCMVGKGIVYDTGGLSIKVPPNMAGMKGDMGGSAAVLGAFLSLVESKTCDKPVHGLLCIAENSVSKEATRPDDVHVMLSGKTVEVNNTDAEGRLVLCDGVYYASQNLRPGYIFDIATLTGAQLVTTGRKHAALFCNDDDLEQQAMRSGIATGDLCFPMLYCPEFHREMFTSQVADMKNSVNDRMNAQSSCAGQFIGNHLESYLDNGGKWCHIDMAGPSQNGNAGRATGYGVALLYHLSKAVKC